MLCLVDWTSNRQCFCFENQIKYIFGYFDPENIFLDNEINYISGVTNPMFRLKTKHCQPDMVEPDPLTSGPFFAETSVT